MHGKQQVSGLSMEFELILQQSQITPKTGSVSEYSVKYSHGPKRRALPTSLVAKKIVW
jgi:hypothetical protein